VISDIDDTVKVTNVGNRRELLTNTLLREFAAVPGMAEVYRRWQEMGTAFHYVSASPWQLANCLEGFLREAGLPSGSMHLKLFRLKDSTPLRRLPSRKRSKRRTIEHIMEDFPRRKFLLVGDSGERDPELYAEVARRHPDRVAGVAIRQVEGKMSREKLRSRLDRLARRVPGGRWHVFSDAADIATLVSGD
jgi:phosphatidate phosphatase APP1